jgi:hypothetical protein
MAKRPPAVRERTNEFLRDLRSEYHTALFAECIRFRGGDIPNMADAASPMSSAIAKRMVQSLAVKVGKGEVSAQALGASFGEATAKFLRKAFARLQHIRPGDWTFSTAQGSGGIARFSQYTHITEIQAVMEKYPELKASLGGDYLITPDIVVSRRCLSDEEINANTPLLDPNDMCAKRSPLRKGNVKGDPSTLHASISMKWSMRSDRAQNARTEALNLIRNRKGATPRIVVVTFEPLPGRIASIAMGTGDVDCTYHAALDELLAAAKEADKSGAQLELLQTLTNGQRLRDISDLPLDLAS